MTFYIEPTQRRSSVWGAKRKASLLRFRILNCPARALVLEAASLEPGLRVRCILQRPSSAVCLLLCEGCAFTQGASLVHVGQCSGRWQGLDALVVRPAACPGTGSAGAPQRGRRLQRAHSGLAAAATAPARSYWQAWQPAACAGTAGLCLRHFPDAQAIACLFPPAFLCPGDSKAVCRLLFPYSCCQGALCSPKSLLAVRHGAARCCASWRSSGRSGARRPRKRGPRQARSKLLAWAEWLYCALTLRRGSIASTLLLLLCLPQHSLFCTYF